MSDELNAPEQPVDNAQADTREKLEADAGELTADYAVSGGVCDALYQGIIDLLDRQAAITIRDYTSEDESCCEACRAAQKRKIAELTAEREQYRDNMLAQTRIVAELTAERDKLQAELKQERIEWECEFDYANICEKRLNEMTAERDELRERLDAMKAVLDKWVKTTVGIEPPEYSVAQFQPNDGDSRERLEEAMHNVIRDALLNLQTAIMQCVEQGMDVLSFDESEFVDYEHDEYVGEYLSRAMRLFDCKAAITERELCAKCEWPSLAVMPDLEQQERIAEQDRRIVEYAEQVDELTAERDQLSRDLTAEHALVCQFEDDNERLKKANRIQAESFRKLEIELAMAKGGAE